MRVRPMRYAVGQWVYYYCPRRFVGRSPKWQKMYGGPYLVTQVMGPVNVRLQASRRATPFVSHIDKLKPCYGVTPVSWLTMGTREQEENALEEVLVDTRDMRGAETKEDLAIERSPVDSIGWH